MKLALLPLLLIVTSSATAADWKIHWEAAKGEKECVIPYAPRPLEKIVTELPAGHSEADADRKSGLVPSSVSITLIGMFKDRKVNSIELQVKNGYYDRYFLIVAEVEPGKYMPIYVHQFGSGSHGHGRPLFVLGEKNFTVAITADTHGTSPSSEAFKITCDLVSPPKTETAAAANADLLERKAP